MTKTPDKDKITAERKGQDKTGSFRHKRDAVYFVDSRRKIRQRKNGTNADVFAAFIDLYAYGAAC